MHGSATRIATVMVYLIGTLVILPIIGSGAWLTNHQKGTYIDGKGKKQKWEYFVKIVAAPASATKSYGIWYAADGTKIGPDIWREFIIIQEVYNDTGTGDHGIYYLSPYSAGFGKFSPAN